MAKRPNNIDSLLGSLSDEPADNKSGQDSSRGAKNPANPAIPQLTDHRGGRRQGAKPLNPPHLLQGGSVAC